MTTSPAIPPDQPPLAPPPESAIRDELERLELLGPRHGLEEELVGQRPRNRYLVGALAPQMYRVRPEELEGIGTSGNPDPEEGAEEPETPTLPTMLPSSIGFSFAGTRETKALRLVARWGRCRKTTSETLEAETGRARRVWKREQLEALRILESRKGVNKQIFIITDGKPSAIREHGRLYKNPFGLDPRITHPAVEYITHVAGGGRTGRAKE